MLRPRLDAGVGDASDVGCLRRDRDPRAGRLGDVAGRGCYLDRIARVRLEVHQNEHTLTRGARRK
ncbi:hypothetical protein BN903_56 [Halorubrum sp. AJ67]|nr:hypothetical protein BN903_56 [Halorubrum sp. AJ67]